MKRCVKQVAIALIGASFFAWAPISLAGARTVYSDDGISELSVPERWSVRPDIGKTAALRIADEEAGRYLVVNSYLAKETKPMPFAKFAEEVSADLLENLQDGKMSKARKLTVNGRPALEYEISGRIGDTRFAYLSTVVEGKHARHHVLGWTLADSYPANRSAIRDAAAAFRESTKQRAAKERIQLVFNWPRQAESKFVFHGKRTKRGKTLESDMRGSTTLRALGENELLVSSQITDFKMRSSEEDVASNNSMQNLLQQVTSDTPDYVVSTEGEFLRVENMGAYHARIEQALLKGLPGDAEAVQQKVKQLLQNLVSEEALTLAMQDEWNNHVYNWADGSYTVGEPYTYAAQYQAPGLGEAAFPMTITQRLLGRVPCHQDDKAKSCVRLEQISRVADPSFSKAMHQFVSKTAKGLAGDQADRVTISVDRAEFVKTVALVVDPETLLPFESKASKVTTIVISEQGRTETTRDVDESVTLYTY